MKKGFVYNLVFGKERKKDFALSDLPKNRVQQFAFVFKTRFGLLFRANLLCALFLLPLCLWDTISGWYVADFVKDMTAAEQMSVLINMTLLRYGTDAVLCALAAAGLSGMYYLVRRLCWGQSVKIADFFAGVKNSGAQFAVVGFVYGALTALFNYLFNFSLLTASANHAFVWVVAQVLTVIAQVLITLIALFCFALSSLYNVKTGKLLANGAVLAFKRLFSALGIAVVSLLPTAIWFVLPWGFLQIIGLCVVTVIGVCYSVTVQTVFCLGVFDVFINKTQYPDFVGKGLCPKPSCTAQEESVAAPKDEQP